MHLIEQIERIAIRLSNRTANFSPAAQSAGAAGFLIGTAVETGEAVVLDTAITQHQYVIGSSGSGKSTYLRRLIETDVARHQSLIVLDQHGDLSGLVLESLAAAKVDPARVLFWDFANSEYVPAINPLVGSGPVHNRVTAMVSAIKRRTESWGVQLDQSIRVALTVLAEQGFSLLEVESLLANQSFRNHLRSKTQDEYARDFLVRFDGFTEEQRRIQASAVGNKLVQFLADPRIRRILGSGDLARLRRAVDTAGQVVILSVPGYALGEIAGVIGEIVTGTIWSTVLSRASVAERDRVPVSLVIDEFQRSVGDEFGSMVTEARRFRLSLCLAHQSQAQLPPTLRALIRNNSAVRLLLSPGVVDASELASELAPLSHADAASQMMTLKTGEGYVVRRGEQAVRVVTPNITQAAALPDITAAFTEAVLRRSARSVGDIDRELADRAKAIARLGAGPALDNREVVKHGRKPWK